MSLRPFLNMLICYSCVIMLQSCSPVTGSLARNDNLGYYNIEGIEFFVDQARLAEIDECILKNEDVKRSILKFHRKDLGALKEVRVNLFESRKIIKRGEVWKGIPKRHLQLGVTCKTFFCADRNGDIVVAKVVSSTQEFIGKEMDVFLQYVFDYKVGAKEDANCLECEILTQKINKENLEAH